VSPRLRVRCGGVTLIELVYALVLLAVLGTVLLPLGVNSLRIYGAVRSDVAQQDQLRYGLERMARELREVRFSPEGEAAFSDFSTHSLTFTRTRRVGASESTETVSLSLQASQLTLAYASLPAVGPQPLVPRVSRLAFDGLDEALLPLALSHPPSAAELARLHAVRIELDATTDSGRTLRRHTTVQLKNRELS
jgi:hypothetical protein